MSEHGERITVVVIGQTQTGKSTFYNRLADLSVSGARRTAEGDKNASCTTQSSLYDLDIPLVEYKVVSSQNGKEFKEPDGLSENDLLLNRWPTKVREPVYRLETRGRPSRILKLRVIDTPGLNDSRNKDFDNISDVLATLNKLAHSKYEEERQVHGIILIEYYTGTLSIATKTKIGMYRECMKNLFGQIIVVNTGFSFKALSSKHSEYRDKGIITAKESVMPTLLKKRQEAYQQVLDQSRNPDMFFIDNKPDPTFLYQDMVSRNTLAAILDRMSRLSPMPIQQMTVQKSGDMKAVDYCLITLLQTVASKIRSEQKNSIEKGDTLESLRVDTLGKAIDLQNQLEQLDEELGRINNDGKFSIHTYSNNPYVEPNWRIWASRLSTGVTGFLEIEEPHYRGFQVKADNSTSGNWTDKRWALQDVKWVGEFQAAPGKRPHMHATSFVTNKVLHESKIKTLQSRRRRCAYDLKYIEDDWVAQSGEGSISAGTDAKMAILAQQLQAADYLIKFLEQPEVSLQSGYGEAARARYQAGTDNIGEQHLRDFVKEAQAEAGELREALKLLEIAI